MSDNPYLSWIVVNRNDGYPADQKSRLNFFIDYLGSLDRRYPGTFETVLCDWNPPTVDSTMLEAFDWSPIEDLTIVTVSAEIHNELTNGAATNLIFPTANNVSLRRTRGTFVGRMNPDIFLSNGISRYFGERRLSQDKFYRADRCDYRPDFEAMCKLDSLDSFARDTAFQLARRGADRMDPIDFTIPSGLRVEEWNGSSPIDGEEVLPSPDLIVGCDEEQEAINRRFQTFLEELKSGWVEPHHIYKIFGLHTNACGDLIVASRDAMDKIRGFPETSEFTAHDDSYAVIQLRAEGYRQAIFSLPECAFHADHDRAPLGSRPEEVPYEEHEKVWSDMLLGKRSAIYNGANWGLVDRNLPVVKLNFGRIV